MKGITRALCCVALVAALVPVQAFAAAKPNSSHKIKTAPTASKAVSRGLALLADEYEPDNTYAEAQLVTSTPLVQDRAIDPIGDVDIYALDATPGTQYTFETVTYGPDDDTIITLVNGDTGALLGEFDDNGDLLSSYGKWTATTGLKHVFAVVRDYDGPDAVASYPYQFKITATPNTVRPAAIKRIDGNNRFVVAVNAAKAIFPAWDQYGDSTMPVTDVIVVCGEDRAMADPLAASSLAGWYFAPLLLTNAVSLPADTERAIRDIRINNGGKVNIHVIGGEGSVTRAVYTKLSGLKGTGGRIERISGGTRFELTAKVADRMNSLWTAEGGSGPDAVLIANGENPASFYDVLAAGGIMYYSGYPLLLTRNGSVPSETSSRLKTKFVSADRIAINGTKYIPTSVYNAVKGVDRMATSSDRYTASVQIAQWGMESGFCGGSDITFVSKLPDALAAGTYAGWNWGPLLYTTPTGPTAVGAKFLTDRKSITDRASVFGGTNSVTPGGYAKIYSLMNAK